MQDILLKVFVVALGLLTYPTDDPRVEEQWGGEDIKQYGLRSLEDEEKLDQETAPVSVEMIRFDDTGPSGGVTTTEKEQLKSGQHEDKTDKMTVLQGRDENSLSDVHTKTSQNKTAKEAVAEWSKDFLCYVWNTFSIISMICFLRKYLRQNSQTSQDKAGAFPLPCVAREVALPDSDTLHNFHTNCVQVSSKMKRRDEEFLEGFANDLLETMRIICNKSGGVVIEDVIMLGASDLNVPFTLPEPHSFQCLLRNNQASDLLPDMQVCGQIQVVENKQTPNGCPCQSSDADNDMVCLLHCETDKSQTRVTSVCDELCSKNAPLLSKSRVARWFQSTIKQAWAQMSHKYEFELSIRYIDAPGTLAIRFRSGKVLRFRLNPVVKFNNAHFCITPCSPRELDTFWTLSLTSYEDLLLQRLSERLPQKACHIQTLEIACFLHRRQTSLFGSSAVKDFHFKTALMHLLLNKDPSQWKANALAQRLQDLMDFMERSLQKKLLRHVLVGNPVTQAFIQLPAELARAKPVNLFHPLVVHSCIYRNAAMHFQETLRNAHVLILDYVDQCTNASM